MAREYGSKRKKSTILRDNMVHRAYQEVRQEIGHYADYVSKGMIYGKVCELTGLCMKTVAAILNHTTFVAV